MNNKKKITLVIIAIALVIVVYFVFTSNTPAQAPTTTSTPTTSSTPDPTSTPDGDIETQDYEFDSAVAQYEMENALTDEDIIADESLKLGLFEWLDDNGVGYINAQEDKEAGCENPFIDEYIEWTYNRANSPSDEGEQPSAENPDLKPGQTVDKNGIIINPDGSMELPSSAAEGVHEYTDEDRAQMEANNESVKEWISSQEYQDKLNEYAERFGY